MHPRRITMIVIFCVAVVPAFALGGQDLQAIPDRSRRIEIPGVSVLPPQGEDWFVFPVSPQEGIPGALIRFVQRLQGAPPRRPEDARQVLAGVVVTNSGEAKPRTPAEFLQAFRGDFSSSVGEMITPRQRLTGFDTVLDDSPGATCVRYSRLTEITGQFPAFPDLVAISSTRGLYCSHPHWPQYHIDLTYQQNYAKSQAPLARDAEANLFLKSIVFTSVRPVARPGPRALYVSHMQAADTAYKEQRWSEAEVSFQAALKAADYFGPTNPMLAMTLYYLASTQAMQGRDIDAEPLFIRAIETFEAQPASMAPDLARIYALALNDLASVYATRASREATPAGVAEQFKRAEPLFKRSLAIREQALGTEHGDVLQTLRNLRVLYLDMRRLDEAAQVARRALPLAERLYGSEHAEVERALETLGYVHLEQGRPAQAEPLYKRALTIAEKSLGPNHPALANLLADYAAVLRKLGRDAEAKEFETRVQAIRAKR